MIGDFNEDDGDADWNLDAAVGSNMQVRETGLQALD